MLSEELPSTGASEMSSRQTRPSGKTKPEFDITVANRLVGVAGFVASVPVGAFSASAVALGSAFAKGSTTGTLALTMLVNKVLPRTAANNASDFC